MCDFWAIINSTKSAVGLSGGLRLDLQKPLQHYYIEHFSLGGIQSIICGVEFFL